jgi:HEAT repeat protein
VFAESENHNLAQRKRVVGNLLHLGATAVPFLITMLENSNEVLQKRARDILELIDTPEAKAALKPLIEKESVSRKSNQNSLPVKPIQPVAIEKKVEKAKKEDDEPKYHPHPFVRALYVDWPNMRIAGANLIRESPDDMLVNELIEALKIEKDKTVQTAFIEVLKSIGTPTALNAIQPKPVPQTSTHALATYWAYFHDRQQPDEIRQKAILHIISTAWKMAVPQLIDALRNEQRPSIAQTIAEALEQLGTPEALAAVEKWEQHRASGE